MLNINQIRQDFPILKQRINQQPLIYFDNAATTQKPQPVIDAITSYYSHYNANAYRGVHTLSEQTTNLIEQARICVQKFIGAKHSHECIWTKGATEAINLVAAGFGSQLTAQDTVAVTVMEHHANFVPWQQLCQKIGAKLIVIPITPEYQIDMIFLKSILEQNIQILALTHVSNTIGAITSLKEIITLAHAHQIPVLVDGAQAGAHLSIDVADLDCDFYVLSPHKMFGPSGVGVLYGKEYWLEKLPPYQMGGHMVSHVTEQHTTFNVLPYKFEAGTLPLASIVGYMAALKYLQQFALADIQAYEHTLHQHLICTLQQTPKLNIIGPLINSVPLVSFTINNIHPHDIGTILNDFGIAVRAGHHCTLPLLHFLNIPSTVRMSLAFYNTLEEINQLPNALLTVQKLLGTK